MDAFTLVLIIFMLALFGFQFFIANKRKKLNEVVQSNIVVGARVMTFSGIVGTITEIADDVVAIKTGTAVIEVKRGAVREALATVEPVVVSQSKPAAKKPANAVTAAKPAVKKTSK